MLARCTCTWSWVVSVSVAIFGLASFLRWVFGAEDFRGSHISSPLVWGALWVSHWRLETLEGQLTELTRSIRRLYAYVVSFIGLGMLVVGAGVVLGQLLGEAYDALFGTTLISPSGVSLWDDTTRTGLAVALIGGVIWWWHWHRVSRGDTESVLRQVYFYVFAILVGVITLVASLSIILFGVLEWLLGLPVAASTFGHFRFFPGAIAAATVGAGLWGYHWAVVRQETHLAAHRMLAARRVYRYLVAALGLGTLAAGLVILFAVVLGLLVPQARGDLVESRWWQGTLALTVTLIAVGVPLWGYYWFGAQREAKAMGTGERTALSRRVFIYLVFGIAVLVALGNLSALLFILFRDVLEGELTLQVLQDTKWSIGMLLMAGTLSVYHWLVLQEDRRAVPSVEELPVTPPPVRKVVIVLATEAAEPLVEQLESRLGYPIQLWRRLDIEAGAPAITEEEISITQQRIAQAPGDRVLLTIDASGVQVVPYEEEQSNENTLSDRSEGGMID